jgi:hypothetical protein
VGDAEPVQAMEDALRLFGADEIIISTHPRAARTGSRRDRRNGRERFAVPITHVVVDLPAEHEESRADLVTLLQVGPGAAISLLDEVDELLGLVLGTWPFLITES